MKIWGVLLISLMTGQQVMSNNTTSNDTNADVFSYVDVMPEFPGGRAAMEAYVSKNLRYPDAALSQKVTGTVHVSFVVTKTGDISDIQVVQGIHSLCDAEAIRVVKAMPKWIPGKQNGQNVNVKFTLPIAFRLAE